MCFGLMNSGSRTSWAAVAADWRFSAESADALVARAVRAWGELGGRADCALGRGGVWVGYAGDG